jgi:3-oxoacyl-[acyl-carrier protein] reductase
MTASVFRSLVFGGSGNVGRALCTILATDGGHVTFTYRSNKAAAQKLAEVPGARAVQLDLRSPEQIEHVIDEAAREGIDGFVHCAGLAVSPGDPVPAEAHQRLLDVSVAGFDALFAVNVRSVFFACRRVARVMRGGGNIVLLGSIAGVKPLPSPVHYAACKGALTGMVQAMAKELGRDNIRVNVVAPGLTEGGVTQSLPPSLIQDYTRHCGLKRLAQPEEIARVVAWLARLNTYVTGQTILLDGAL